MPIYEYVCTACGKEFEAIQKFSDEPLTSCSCGKSGTVERKLSLSAFQLKGSGWYKDRYGSANSKNGSNGSSTGDPAGKGASAEAGKNGGAATKGDAAASKSGESGSAKSGDSGSAKSGESGSAKSGESGSAKSKGAAGPAPV